MFSKNVVTKSSKCRTRRPVPDSEAVAIFYGEGVKPYGKMPLSAHTEAGRLLKEVLEASNYSESTYNLVNKACLILSVWAEVETRPGHPSEVLVNLDPLGSPSQTIEHVSSGTERERHIASLRKVQQMVVTYYRHCCQRQNFLEILDSAITLLEDLILPLES